VDHSTSGDTVPSACACATSATAVGRVGDHRPGPPELGGGAGLTSRAGATTRLLPDHYPDRLTRQGVYVFIDTTGGSTRRLEGELKVRAPLVGGRAEKALVSGLQEHAAAEQQLIESRLS
jgi:hypothetical protein